MPDRHISIRDTEMNYTHEVPALEMFLFCNRGREYISKQMTGFS